MIGRGVALRDRPRNIIALGCVSLFMGISSMMILSLLPAFLVKELGASAVWVGTIEGIAESTASVTKVFSGAISDRLGRRKPLVVVGYALSALIKLVFPLAHSVSAILIARTVDRIGKGMRDAPRDAFLADITSRGLRGSGFGLRQALFSFGAVLGPLIAIGLMMLTGDNFRAVYWAATIPGFLALAVLVWRVEEVPARRAPSPAAPGLNLCALRLLPRMFWQIVAFSLLISLARFSPAFLLLKAAAVGIDPGMAPLVLVLVNSVYSTTSYPLGVLADRLGRRILAVFGTLTLFAAESVLALSDTPGGTALGAALWGLQLGVMQGLFGAIIADHVPDELRGTAFGMFDLATGMVVLVASILAGAFWAAGGAPYTYGFGGLLSLIAVVALAIKVRQRPARRD